MSDDNANDRLRRVEVILGGDMQTPGMAHNMIRLMNDLYTPPNGLVHRIDGIEKWQLRNEERAKGAVWMARLMWGALCFLIGIVAQKYLH